MGRWMHPLAAALVAMLLIWAPAQTALATSPNSGYRSLLTGSTKISMIPPHVRPTLKAVSSLMPYRWSTGWPLAITSPASS